MPARHLAFRRFVVGFYTPEFRDLFFSEDPTRLLFRAVVAVLAGYWRPRRSTRALLWLFFISVRLQARFGFAASHLRDAKDVAPEDVHHGVGTSRGSPGTTVRGPVIRR